MGKLIEQIGVLEMLEQTAEEASELSKACLKLSRKYRVINPTSKTKEELISNLYEEIADIEICLEELKTSLDKDQINNWKNIKYDKINKRIDNMVQM